MIQGSNKYQNIFIICWELGQKNDKKRENAILLNRTQPQKVFFAKIIRLRKPDLKNLWTFLRLALDALVSFFLSFFFVTLCVSQHSHRAESIRE